MIRFGWMRFTRAAKVWRCARGQYCTNGDYIEKEEWHFSTMTRFTKKVRAGYMAGDLGDDGSGPSTISKSIKLPIVRHLHISCLQSWAEHNCTELDKAVPLRGRPKGSSSSILSPEERTIRRKLIDRRKYLFRKIHSTTNSSVMLRALHEIVEIGVALGTTIKPSEKRNQTNLPVYRKIQNLVCEGNLQGKYCDLGEDQHCIHCGRCFDSSHVDLNNAMLVNCKIS